MTTPQPQQGAKVEPQAETVPIDHSKPLTPTHALSITHTKHHTIIIQDLTPSISSLFSSKDGLAIEEATKLIDATPAPPTLYTLKKENLLGTHLTVHDKEGKEVAEWKNPILSFRAGKVTIKFLGEQEQKTVEVNPIGHERISEVCPFSSCLLCSAQVLVCYISCFIVLLDLPSLQALFVFISDFRILQFFYLIAVFNFQIVPFIL
jgi:hypothetical protein